MIRIVAWLLLLLLPLQQAPTPPAPDPPLRTAPLGEPDEPTPTEAPRHLLPAGTLCARAEQLFDDGGGEALKGAGKLFGIAASRFPHEPCGHAGLARTLVASYARRIEPDDTQVTEALEAARRAASLAPDSPLARAALATALFADLRPIEAERQASSALGLDPDSIPALLAAAQARIALSRHADAREALDRALRIAPALPAAHLLEGHLHLVQGSAHDAVDSYSRALLLSPDYLPALLQLAVALTEAGRAAEASAAFRQIVEENPGESSRANLLMAHALMKSGVWAPALKLLERAEFTTLRGLSNGTVHYMRGVCL
ncbi:MAG TPA: tetratricopeptide repeat protein, partial [Candidatus Polarisedimenticolia bacterium]|nr:tetratricopeptide repeat protein [Candidatus Polarisedimenticolia bacterium]